MQIKDPEHPFFLVNLSCSFALPSPTMIITLWLLFAVASFLMANPTPNESLGNDLNRSAHSIAHLSVRLSTASITSEESSKIGLICILILPTVITLLLILLYFVTQWNKPPSPTSLTSQSSKHSFYSWQLSKGQANTSKHSLGQFKHSSFHNLVTATSSRLKRSSITKYASNELAFAPKESFSNNAPMSMNVSLSGKPLTVKSKCKPKGRLVSKGKTQRCKSSTAKKRVSALSKVSLKAKQICPIPTAAQASKAVSSLSQPTLKRLIRNVQSSMVN